MNRLRLPVAIRAICFAVVVSTCQIAATAAVSQSDGRRIRLPSEEISRLPGPLRRHAVVIGVDAYEDRQITPLHGAAQDARALADALSSYAGFPSSQITLLSTSEAPQARPTRSLITQKLAQLVGQLPEGGLIFLAFSGHGVEINGKSYLLPSDTRVGGSSGILENTAIAVEDLKQMVRATGADQVILLLDACRNDPLAGRSVASSTLSPAFARAFDFDTRNRGVKAFVTLYATAPKERAFEYADKKMGFFTWAVVEGLSGKAANTAGEVTLSGLLTYVEETVPPLVRRYVGASVDQRPWHSTEGFRAEDLVLSAPSGTPKAASVGQAATLSEQADLDFWRSISASTDPAEYKAYLATFPQGKFVELAKARLSKYSAGSAAGATDSGTKPAAPPSSGVFQRVEGQVFTYELVRCVRRGDLIECDIYVTSRDQDRIFAVFYGFNQTEIYDDTGNVAECYDAYVGNQRVNGNSVTLVARVRTLMKLRFNAISPSARKLSLIKIGVSTDGYNLGPLQFRDVPIGS
jgi:uncharacterized caspase-like protein